MRDICVWLVVLSQTFFGVCYILRIRKKKAAPTISTWIIFLVGCGLSFPTYVSSEKWDLKSGILNTTDLVYVVLILLATILWGKRDCKTEEDEEEERKRKIFERWYLSGAAGIVAYGVISGNAWNSNVLTQVLMSFAYLPMWHKMVAQKKNTESFMGWIPVSSIFALYPAIYEGNALSVIYSARAFILCLITTLMMAYYQFIRPLWHRFFW